MVRVIEKSVRRKKNGRKIFAWKLILALVPLIGPLISSPAWSVEKYEISLFSAKSLSGWEEKQFAGKTEYSFVRDEQEGWVLKAVSNGSASGLVKQERIDLNKYPYLNWSWKAQVFPKVEDEKTKDGDDYPARIYVIFKTGSWFWNTRALNYVWNSHYPPDEAWPNAFTANAYVMAVESGTKKAGRWVTEKRNIQADIQKCFGIKVDVIEAVAIMTDSDNSADKAVAYYGDIYLSDK